MRNILQNNVNPTYYYQSHITMLWIWIILWWLKYYGYLITFASMPANFLNIEARGGDTVTFPCKVNKTECSRRLCQRPRPKFLSLPNSLFISEGPGRAGALALKDNSSCFFDVIVLPSAESKVNFTFQNNTFHNFLSPWTQPHLWIFFTYLKVVGTSIFSITTKRASRRCFVVSCTYSIRATSHTSQEPWPWNCESPKERSQRPFQDTSKIM